MSSRPVTRQLAAQLQAAAASADRGDQCCPACSKVFDHLNELIGTWYNAGVAGRSGKTYDCNRL